jgi:hypothetical protein
LGLYKLSVLANIETMTTTQTTTTTKETGTMMTQIVNVNGITATVLITGALTHVPSFDALTPSGAGFSGAGSKAECASYRSGSKKLNTPRWQRFYRALGARDTIEIVAAAKGLPSVRVRLDLRHTLNPNFGFTVARGSWLLFVAPIVES